MKLLIVDDEYHVIKSIKFLLSTFPLHFDQIFSASSVKEASVFMTKRVFSPAW